MNKIQVRGIILRKIMIIVGPSGAGKTSVSDYLCDRYQIPRVVTHTTRPKRSGEVDGEAYYFEDAESFKRLHFFEHVVYSGAQYGSSHEALVKAWSKSDLVSLIVEMSGVFSYLHALKTQVVLIYLTVSHPETMLRQRLIARGDAPKAVDARLASPEFRRDLKLPDQLKPFAHVIVNDDWAETKQKLDALVASLRDSGEIK